MPPEPIERFESKIEEDPRTGCWLWTGATTGAGYGNFWVDGRSVNAHRWSFERWIGAVPSGAVLDHLCGIRRCVNPGHLESVTNRENLLRGDTIPARNREHLREVGEIAEHIKPPVDAPFSCPHCGHTWLKHRAACRVRCPECHKEIT